MNDKNKFPFYDRLTVEEKNSLVIKTYSKGDDITEFVKRDHFYFILEGKLKLLNFLEGVTIRSASTLSEGYLVGILRFLNNKLSDDDALILSNRLKVIKIPIEIVRKLKDESLEFNKYLVDLTLKRAVEEYQNLYIRTYFGLKGLIARFLIEESENNFVYIENFNRVIENLNISSNGFYRAITQLVEGGFIEKSENSIKILDNKKLMELYTVTKE